MPTSLRNLMLTASSLALLSACGPTASPPMGVDASADMASTVDAVTDTAPAVDAPIDAPADVRPDAIVDVTPDRAVIDAPIDARPDAAPDAPPDVRSDAVSDVQPPSDVVAGATCGGRGGHPCGTGLYCNFPPSSICGAADGPGTCDVIPEACTDEYRPVCGCDGHTYGNACEAAAASVSVTRTGTCEAGDAGTIDAGTTDCRTSGCSTTSTCMPCRGAGGVVYACIPMGAAC